VRDEQPGIKPIGKVEGLADHVANRLAPLKALEIFQGAGNAVSLDRIVDEPARPFRCPPVLVPWDRPVQRAVFAGLDDIIVRFDLKALPPPLVQDGYRAVPALTLQ
jgi:hypothetical protein